MALLHGSTHKSAVPTVACPLSGAVVPLILEVDNLLGSSGQLLHVVALILHGAGEVGDRGGEGGDGPHGLAVAVGGADAPLVGRGKVLPTLLRLAVEGELAALEGIQLGKLGVGIAEFVNVGQSEGDSIVLPSDDIPGLPGAISVLIIKIVTMCSVAAAASSWTTPTASATPAAATASSWRAVVAGVNS